MADLAPLPSAQIQTQQGRGWFDALPRLLPGISVAALIALSVGLIERQFGGPIMLYGLIAGMLAAPLANRAPFKTGIDFSAKEILKLGIILLGARLTLAEITALGWQTAIMVILAIAATISIGWWIGRRMRLESSHAVISAGAVAICGASAALAICAVLPKDRGREKSTVITILSVTIFSTLAMVLYPVVSTMLGFDDTEAGIFMGMTIHNVAQVIGAGYVVSPEAAETATIVKLMRIACLVPAVVVISIIFSRTRAPASTSKTPPLLPMFLVGFVCVMLINTFGFLSVSTAASMSTLSHWALVMSLVALGAKTPFKELLNVGPRGFAAMGLQTIFLAAFAVGAIVFAIAA